MLCLGPRCGLVGWKKIGLKGSETPKKTPFRQKTLNELVYTREERSRVIYGETEVCSGENHHPKMGISRWEFGDLR